MKSYLALERRFSQISAAHDAVGILNWDSQTMMPVGAARMRAEQQATLRALAHRLLTDAGIGDLLEAASGESLDAWQTANLREMRRSWRHASAVPAALVEANSKATSHCELVWRTARVESDFKSLLPSLKDVLACQRDIAAAKADHLGLSPYDSLLESFEAGLRSDRINPLFTALAAVLPDLLQRALDAQKKRPPALQPAGPFPLDRQRALARKLMGVAGFDFSRGRLDESLHPFCGGATDDVRITTRYDEANYSSALLGVLHETGHALYEQNRPEAWSGQPVGHARGMAAHESQSLLIEMQVCRSRTFLAFAAPVIKNELNGEGPAWEAENLYRLGISVKPGFIRVDADEVTYPAHVILRTELEQALIEGRLALEDLPDAWNAGMKRLLGVVPPNDALGCLQDIHWPTGAFGYFPTYTLGAMMAAQLFDAACAQKKDLRPALAKGDFGPLKTWLRNAVHAVASFPPTSDDLLLAATGEALSPKVFLKHLERRYIDDAGW